MIQVGDLNTVEQRSVVLSRSSNRLILVPVHSGSTCEPMRDKVRESLGLPRDESLCFKHSAYHMATW